jgi:hypothetical protein
MEKFHIIGPTRLAGRVRASGAKNAALPALAASLLTDEPLVLHRVPRVRDLRTMGRLLDHLGVANEEKDGALVFTRTRPNNPDADEAPYDLVKTMRASVLVLGPLLARFGRARVSLPGGCAIGVRPIDQHLKGLEALGADIHLTHGYVETVARRLTGARFRFDVATVTGTENVLMPASPAPAAIRWWSKASTAWAAPSTPSSPTASRAAPTWSVPRSPAATSSSSRRAPPIWRPCWTNWPTSAPPWRRRRTASASAPTAISRPGASRPPRTRASPPTSRRSTWCS